MVRRKKRDEKRTYASVTTKPCTCAYLERESRDDQSPIVYDATLNEFHFKYEASNGSRSLVIYHCPFCGGAVPESRRETLFAMVSSKERSRLEKLTSNISSISDAFAQLGPPDRDDPTGVTVSTPEHGMQAPTIQSFRRLTYSKLSDVAEIHIVENRIDGVQIYFQGKELQKE